VRQAKSVLSGDHWRLLNPNGGILIIHNMLNTQGGQMLVDEFFKVDQANRPNEIELIGMLEPQRMNQNNFVMLRKISGGKPEQIDPLFTATSDSVLEDEARALAARR